MIYKNLVNYEYNMHDNTLSSSLDDYLSDYSSIGDNSIDKTLRNRLVNIHNEEIFMLQHDLFMNYGPEIYEKVMEEYKNTLKKINFNDFNEDIWEKIFELYKTRNDLEESFCFKCFPSKKIDVTLLYNLFILLNNIHVYAVKSKIWLNIVNQIKTQ